MNFFFFGIGYEECGVFNVGRIFFLGVEITVLEFFLESVGRGLRKGVLTFRERQRDHHTTDTRDRQHDDDFEKGLDCGDHLSVLDPPFDGAAGCLRVWFSGGWGGGTSSNRLTISGPGYSRTVGQDGSVKQSFEQTTTGKR